MVQAFCGFIGLLWIFPLIWFMFGEENTWWIMSLIISCSAIMVLCGMGHVFDKVKKETEMQGNDVFYIYDYLDSHKEE